jgi:hypothetical protein
VVPVPNQLANVLHDVCRISVRINNIIIIISGMLVIWLLFSAASARCFTQPFHSLSHQTSGRRDLLDWRHHLLAPWRIWVFSIGRKDRARRIPQERGIPRRIELRQMINNRLWQSLPSIIPRCYIACAVTSNTRGVSLSGESASLAKSCWKLRHTQYSSPWNDGFGATDRLYCIVSI